jgi:DNA-binding NtrC family response regulator
VEPTRLFGESPPITRILVVDDEESVCKVIARSLAAPGFDIDTALDADSALDAMRVRRADVALVDIRMPGHDGAWLIDRLQEQYPRTAIIIITGIRELDPRLTLRPGVTSYLTKPFTAADVRDAVTKALAAVALLPKDGAPADPRPVSEHDIPDIPD